MLSPVRPIEVLLMRNWLWWAIFCSGRQGEKLMSAGGAGGSGRVLVSHFIGRVRMMLTGWNWPSLRTLLAIKAPARQLVLLLLSGGLQGASQAEFPTGG